MEATITKIIFESKHLVIRWYDTNEYHIRKWDDCIAIAIGRITILLLR